MIRQEARVNATTVESRPARETPDSVYVKHLLLGRGITFAFSTAVFFTSHLALSRRKCAVMCSDGSDGRLNPDPAGANPFDTFDTFDRGRKDS
jgi:hypothetical protein